MLAKGRTVLPFLGERELQAVYKQYIYIYVSVQVADCTLGRSWIMALAGQPGPDRGSVARSDPARLDGCTVARLAVPVGRPTPGLPG